jgi:hypothetical protein
MSSASSIGDAKSTEGLTVAPPTLPIPEPFEEDDEFEEFNEDSTCHSNYQTCMHTNDLVHMVLQRGRMTKWTKQTLQNGHQIGMMMT